MKKWLSCLLIATSILISCTEKVPETSIKKEAHSKTTVAFANGFSIQKFKNYTLLEVTEAFPNSKKSFTYALVPDGNFRPSVEEDNAPDLNTLLKQKKIDAIIKTPVEKIVVTSTTHIPSLEMLGVAHTLVGFPNRDYISSPLSRKRIENGEITELGQNESLNTELAINLEPDAVVTFGVEGENTSINSLQRAGIPVLYNGDWVEKNPLGKAEWIKFFGALYGKEKLADSLFTAIKNDYLSLKKKVQTIQDRPTVLSGALYKDVWYLPKGNSWQAQILQDAGGDYLWSDTEGAGSIALSIESVLDKGQKAEYWVAPGQYTSYTKLESDNPVYGEFEAFQSKRVYTFAKGIGEKGGVLYYELAPNRPDLVLKDLIKILHPELINQPFTFFAPLDD